MEHIHFEISAHLMDGRCVNTESRFNGVDRFTPPDVTGMSLAHSIDMRRYKNGNLLEQIPVDPGLLTSFTQDDIDSIVNDAAHVGFEMAIRMKTDVYRMTYTHTQCGAKWELIDSCSVDAHCPVCGQVVAPDQIKAIQMLSADPPLRLLSLSDGSSWIN